MLNTGIIGLGQIGYKIDQDSFRKQIWSHAKAYNVHNESELIAVSDLDLKNYNNFSKYYPKINYYNNYLKMIDTIDLDIISICTPISTHLNIVKNISKVNPPKAIFLEKPMGKNLKEATQISKLCNDAGIILAVNYMRRWDKNYESIQSIINKGDFGDMQSISAYGSTALLTSASHLIDLMLFFSGDIDWVIGELQDDYIRLVHDMPDPGGIAFIKFKNNAYGFLKGTSAHEKNFMFEIDIIFEKGRIIIKEPWLKNDFVEINQWEFLPRDKKENVFFHTLTDKSHLDLLTKEERMLEAISDIKKCIEKKQATKSNDINAMMVHQVIEKIKCSSNNNKKRIPIDN